MLKPTLTLLAALAGLAAGTAFAMGSAPPLNTPSTWPAPGAFDKKRDAAAPESAEAVARTRSGLSAPAPNPPHREDEARAR